MKRVEAELLLQKKREEADDTRATYIVLIEAISQLAILIIASMAIANAIEPMTMAYGVLGFGGGLFLLEYAIGRKMQDRNMLRLFSIFALYATIFGSLVASSHLSVRTVGWILLAPKLIMIGLCGGYMAKQALDHRRQLAKENFPIQ